MSEPAKVINFNFRVLLVDASLRRDTYRTAWITLKAILMMMKRDGDVFGDFIRSISNSVDWIYILDLELKGILCISLTICP